MASLEDRVSAPAEKLDWAAEDTMAAAQVDGATPDQGGSSLITSNYEVEVKLIDANSPLYSVKSFDELGL